MATLVSVYGTSEGIDEIDDVLWGDLAGGFTEPFIKRANGYLIWLEGCTWNGASGFRLLEIKGDDCTAVFSRSYETSLAIVKTSKGKKYVEIKEYSHDVPQGYRGHILALTSNEIVRVRNIFNRHRCGSALFDRAVKRMFRGYT